jgi:hypothetical protein
MAWVNEGATRMHAGVGRSVRGAVLLVTWTLLSGCMTEARREIEADRVELHTEPLTLHGPKGAPEAHVGTDGSVTIGDQAIVLDARQRSAALAYREAALKVVDLSLDNASKYVRFAVPRTLFGMVAHGGSEGADKSMDKSADKIVHTPAFCDALDAMRAKQDAMVDEIDRLQPYRSLTSADVQHCRAGEPYTI